MLGAFTWTVFLLTYAGLAIGKFPWLRIDRTGIALVGATAYLIAGVVSLNEAVAAVNFETLLLLFGMMVLVAHLRLGGFFERIMELAERRIRSAHGLLAVVIVLAGVLSALLVNDVVCVAMTPLVIRLARKLGFNPLPHLIGLATASNIGSAATIIGNPQNMIIGTSAGISFMRFSERLAPIAVIGLVVDFVLVALIFRNTLQSRVATNSIEVFCQNRETPSQPRRWAQTWMLGKSLTVALAAVGLFFTALPKELIALGAAAFMLLGRVRPTKVYRQIDWELLLMFAALFVVVDVFNKEIVTGWRLETWTSLLESPVVVLSAVSAFLSNLVSNVPAVLLFQPLIAAMPADSRETAWLALAMSSTLAGNFTLLGSVANLIVVEGARREMVAISFWHYFVVGLPLTLTTLAIGVAWLQWVA